MIAPINSGKWEVCISANEYIGSSTHLVAYIHTHTIYFRYAYFLLMQQASSVCLEVWQSASPSPMPCTQQDCIDYVPTVNLFMVCQKSAKKRKAEKCQVIDRKSCYVWYVHTLS